MLTPEFGRSGGTRLDRHDNPVRPAWESCSKGNLDMTIG
jgi:hypothetical protein